MIEVMRISLPEDQSAFSGHKAPFPILAFERVSYLVPLIRLRGSSPSRQDTLKSSSFDFPNDKVCIPTYKKTLVKTD